MKKLLRNRSEYKIFKEKERNKKIRLSFLLFSLQIEIKNKNGKNTGRHLIRRRRRRCCEQMFFSAFFLYASSFSLVRFLLLI
jgi:hypothetical protein